MANSGHEGVPPVETSAVEPPGGLNPMVKVAVVFVMLGVAAVLLIGGLEEDGAIVYSKLVHELDDGHVGRELRVEGDLKPGSLQFREDPCEYRFVIQKEGRELRVQFPQCIVPDTFKDGMGLVVTVEGKLQPEGHFVASKVIPRCPSKYEMQQRQAAGEEMPHAAPIGGKLPLDG